MIDLNQFVGDDGREFLLKPWRFGKFIYASDGKIIVRIPDDLREGVSLRNIHIGAAWDHEKRDGWIQIPSIPDDIRYVCEFCKDGCEDCDFERVWFESVRMPFEGYDLGTIFLRKISTLPGILIAASAENPWVPVPFKFDGGCGYIMPMRPVNRWEKQWSKNI